MRARQFVLVAILSLTASAARAETIDVSDFQGGLLSTYQTQRSPWRTRGKGPNCGPLRIRMHDPCWLYSAQQHLRHAQRVSWIPLGYHRLPHARDVERLSAGYPPVDQPAWRPHLSNALATGPKHLPLFSQVLSGKTPQSHELSEKKARSAFRWTSASDPVWPTFLRLRPFKPQSRSKSRWCGT
jgi:hypothetical protein